MQSIIASADRRVGIVKLNDVASQNALTSRMLGELGGVVELMDLDPMIKVILLTGVGPHFCSGAATDEITSLDVTKTMASNFSGSCERLGNVKKPVIAAVDGHALGGGCELVEMCDIVIASEKAVFGHPEVTLGLVPGCGGTQRLPRVVGKARAMDMLLTARVLNAAEAYQAGLISRVVPAAHLWEEAMSVALQIATMSAPVVQMLKTAVLSGLDGPLSTGLALERRLFQLNFALADRAEGMAALNEKRAPTYQDR